MLAHPQALAQCRRWLAAHLPGVATEEVSSNSRAAELAAGDPQAAAIAGHLAAEHYKLNLLAVNIQDPAANFTRFAVLGREPQLTRPSGHDRTSLLLSVRDEVGVLCRTLKPFADNAISLQFESGTGRSAAARTIVVPFIYQTVSSPVAVLRQTRSGRPTSSPADFCPCPTPIRTRAAWCCPR